MTQHLLKPFVEKSRSCIKENIKKVKRVSLPVSFTSTLEVLRTPTGKTSADSSTLI